MVLAAIIAAVVTAVVPAVIAAVITIMLSIVAMTMLGVDVGPARLPNASLTLERTTQLRAVLEKLGFFDWRCC